MSLTAHLFAGLLSFVTLHPLHVSVTEIEMDDNDKQLEITMRVFVDDAEQTLRNNLKLPELDIMKPSNRLTIDQMMGDYLKAHFKLSLDRKSQQIKYLGHEIEDDAFIFYLEVTHIKNWKSIQVFNDSMCETFDDQSNLVHVTVQKTTHSIRLTPSAPVGTLNFASK